MVDKLEWKSGYGPASDGTKNCVAMEQLQLVNIPCDNTDSYYYSKATDGDDYNTKPVLSYLCEARILETKDDAHTCQATFKYITSTYDSCSHAEVSGFVSAGTPWCATQVIMQS